MVFLALINNVALALALTIVLGLLWRKRSYEDLPAQVLAGLLFGGVAVVAMMNPLRFAPGIVFDTRSIVVSLAGLCAGPVTAILSAAAAAAYRLALGGIGAWTGIGTIVTSAAIGVAFFYLVPRARSTRPVFLLLFGFVVHIFVLAWMLTLPWAQAWLVLQKISWPMLTLYPVGTLLMGLLLAAQYRHHRAELALSASEKQYRNLAESINDVFFALDRDLRYTYWNRASEELTGIPAKKAVGKTLYQIFPDVRGTKIEDKYLEALRTDRPVFFENEYQVAGQDHVFAISAYPTADGLTVFTKDITERHLHENTLIHLNRILRLQSACNQVLVTAREESDLFEEICRLIVDQGGYKFAWVGLAETDEARTVRLAASFGLEEGYLDQVNITWADTECGRGPTGTAIRTGEPVVCREVESNGSYGPWREEALRRGFASSVALLLEGEGRVFGALNIYADEPDAFDEEEMRLLSEMAADLAYGVTALRTGVLRLKAEREVLMYQGLINQSSDAKYVTDRATGKILYVNDQACQDLDYTRDELLRMNVKDIDPTIPDEAARQKKFVQVLEKDCRLRIESEHRRRDGSTFPVELSIKAVARQDQRFSVFIARNITERKRAEEERDRLFNLSLDMLSVAGFDGHFKQLNPAWTQTLGWTEAELLSKPWLEFVHPEDREDTVAAGKRLIEGQTVLGFENRYQCSDGSYRWISWNSFPLPDENLIFAVARDITEHKRKDALLEERQHFLQQILDTEPGTVYIYDLVERRNVYINRPWMTEYGYTPEEKASLGEDLYGRLFHPDDLERIEAHHQTWRQADDGQTREIEYRLRTKDGDWRWLHSRETAFARDDVGQVSQILGIAHDITERKRAEETLKEQLDFFQTLIDNIPNPIFFKDVDGVYVGCNQAFEEYLGFDKSEIVGKTVYDVSPPDLAEKYRRADSALFENPGTQVYDAQVRYADGSLRDVIFHKRTYHDTEGRLAGLVGVITDVTERVRAEAEKKMIEDQFLQAQKMEAVGRLAGGVAHDFNNLLTIIIGYGDLVLQQLQQDDPIRKEVEEIKNAGVRAAALTRQLLAFSRRQILEPRVLEMNYVIGNLEKMLRRLIGEDVELVVKLDPAAGHVIVDPGQLEQVILNLAVNARDAMPQGGQLLIETGPVVLGEDYLAGQLDVPHGPYVMVAVSDTGTGIDDEVRELIFEPFFTTKGTGKGTGLGLSTVFGIIKQSGGDIHVYSEPGQGTTFRIYLPQTVVDGKGLVQPRKKAAPSTGTETILLVEDEAGLRKLAVRVLEEKGYRVVPAASGAEALSLLERHESPLHLLLTDVVMPGMSGKELADQVQSVRPDIKVLFMSGYTDDAIAHHGVLNLEYNLISKPFQVEDLAKKTREVLDT